MIIFNAEYRQGNFIETANQIVPVNTSVVVKQGDKGRTTYFDNTADLDGYGVISGVKTIVSVIKHSDNTKLFQDDGSDKLEISGGAMLGTGMTQNYVNNVDTDSVINDVWQLIITEFSAGINFATDFEIDPTASIFLQRILMYNTILTTRERELLYQEFLHSYAIQESVINVAKLRSVATFDGVDDYVDVGNIALDIKSISFWINVDDITANTDYIIDLNGTDYVTIINGTITVNGFAAASTNIYVNNVAASTIAVIKQWNHVVISSDIAFTASDLDIGRLEGSGYLGGRLSEIEIFSDELSVANIAALYKDRLTLVIPIGSWKLNEGSGLIAYDSSGNDNHGTITDINESDFWQQTRGKLSSDDVFVNEDLTNQNADGITTAAGKFLGNWRVATGSFRCKENSDGKYIDCVTNGTIQLRGVNLSELIGNGYIRNLSGDLSDDAEDTVDNATNVAWADNILTLTMTSEQKLRNLVITRGA